MSTQGQQAAEIWQNPEFAKTWTEADDSRADWLGYPRSIAASLVTLDRPDTSLVIDIASGPGGFLTTFLEWFPAARGVWNDASETMLESARERLAGFDGRVEYVLGDMTDLAAADLPRNADVVLTSRAAHHLDRDTLAAFYREAAGHLAPGGWLINLDHIGPSEVWNRRFRAARKAMSGGGGGKPKPSTHHHSYPLTSIQDHLDGYHAAGIDDVDIAWKAYFTCMFVGRKSD